MKFTSVVNYNQNTKDTKQTDFRSIRAFYVLKKRETDLPDVPEKINAILMCH